MTRMTDVVLPPTFEQTARAGSTAAHTTGPWAVEDPMGPENLWIVEAGKQTHEWRCIAMVCSDDPINDEDRDPVAPITIVEQQANARLIAAAPELLAAAMSLEVAEEAHANCDECNGEEVPELCPKCFPLFDDARLKRRAAIAAVKAGAL